MTPDPDSIVEHADLFVFEVPTSRGRFRIIGPDTLDPDEARAVAARIARLLPALVLEPDPDSEERTDPIVAGIPRCSHGAPVWACNEENHD